MAGENFTVEEIRAIIKECRESGVASLKAGNLDVSFLPPEPKIPEAVTLSPEQQKQADADQREVFLANEVRLREETLANLRLTDPEAYEDLVTRGELVNAGEKPDRANA